MSDLVNQNWPSTTIKSSSYLKGRIGWQGLRASEFTDNGPYLITGTDFHDGKIDWSTCYHVTEERFREGTYIHVRNGDLLITKDGTIGKVAYVTDCPDKAVLNSGIFLLRCIDGTYDHRFLFHLLNSSFFEKFLRLNLAGSTINHLYQNVFERFQFPIPDIKLQRRIAEILSTLDETIEQTEALIAKMQQVKAGLMHDLFTRGVTPDGRLRPIREQEPELYKESPLGWIPREWEVASVEDMCSEIVDCPHSTPTYVPSGIPCIRTADMLPGKLLLDQAFRISEEEYRVRVIRLVPQKGDIIYSREGERLGIASPVGDERVCLGQRVMLLRPAYETNSDFLVWSMNAPGFYKRIVAGLGATTSPHVNVRDIRRALLTRPSSGEQSLIGQALSTQESYLDSEERKFGKFFQQKQGLMLDLLTGRVRE